MTSTITVPDRAIVASRLREIGGSWLEQKLTPLLATRFGTELVDPAGIDLTVELALYDLFAREGLPPAAEAALRMNKDAICDALRPQPGR